ncbi:hypothetical protein ACFPZ0_04070 [Streptomonospora nanhaiensis]|uniref:hypothetical protein n=1 Tax=Streptomonospora nanhaiensis TaxID=1323731 RepID=UPI001C991F2C|nr:hypothetical protein [Streptomonospora nanhaiensis]MBX9388161.1 hypothetical protein [Streptomonospora nanhaiensis]
MLRNAWQQESIEVGGVLWPGTEHCPILGTDGLLHTEVTTAHETSARLRHRRIPADVAIRIIDLNAINPAYYVWPSMDNGKWGGTYFATLDPKKMPKGKDWCPTLASTNHAQMARMLEYPPDRVEVSQWRETTKVTRRP